MRTLALVPLVLVAFAGSARADVIGGDRRPPECPNTLECPEGSEPTTLSHSGCPSVCRPNDECTTANDCVERYGAGARCEATRFCIEVRAEGPGMSEAVTGSCRAGRGCARNARCSEVSRCVAPPGSQEVVPPAAPQNVAEPPPRASGGGPSGGAAPARSPARGGSAGCSAVAARADGSLGLGVVVAGAWLRRRRRRGSAATARGSSPRASRARRSMPASVSHEEKAEPIDGPARH